MKRTGIVAFTLLSSLASFSVVQTNSVEAQVPVAPASRVLVSNGVGDFTLGPSGQRVFYDVDVPATSNLKKDEWLFVVSRDGGAPVQLDALMADFDGSCLAVEVAPDESFAVFLGVPRGNPSAPYGLWKAPVSGGPSSLVAPITTTMAFSVGSDAYCNLPFRLSPDGSRLIYTTFGVSSSIALYSALTNGGGVTLLSDKLLNSSINNIWQVSPSGSHVAFVTEPEGIYSLNTLYTVPISGPAGAAVRLASSPRLSWNLSAEYEFSRDGSRILYFDGLQVWTAEPAGTGRALVAERGPGARLSPNGQSVVFASLLPTQLVSVPTMGPPSASITQTVDASVGYSFSFVDGSERVAMFADRSYPMFVLAVDGSATGPSTGPVVAGAQPYNPNSPGRSERFVFEGLDAASGQPAVFSAKVVGPDFDVRQLTPGLVEPSRFLYLDPRSLVSRFRYADSGRIMVYENQGLYFVRLDGSAPRTVVSATAEIRWLLTPDTKYLVYVLSGGLYVIDLFPGCTLVPAMAPAAPPVAPASPPSVYLPSIGRCY